MGAPAIATADEEDEFEKEVKEFNFRHLCKLTLGSPVEKINNRLHHLAISNKYGLLFAVSGKDIKVVSMEILERMSFENSVNDAAAVFPHVTIPVGFDIQKIGLNSDETNLILIYNDGSALQLGAIDICIVHVVSGNVKPNAVYASMNLHSSADVNVRDLCCHPEMPGVTAICLSNGHVLMLELTANDGFKIIGSLTQGSPVCCVCWSPKGKQIVVGQADGKLIQYDKLLKSQKKVTPCPDVFNGDTKEVGGLFWISTYFYMAVYNHRTEVSELPMAIMVQTQKDGPPIYTVLDDIYFGFNEDRLLHYYFSYTSEWKLMITMASNAMEAIAVGMIDNKWYRWALQDNGRAEVPLSSKNNEDAFPVGIGICLNSTLPIKQDDLDLPPAPIFVMLSTDGVLCTYQMVNQFPNTNHGILKKSSPVPSATPKTGVVSSFQQPVASPMFNFGSSTGTVASSSAKLPFGSNTNTANVSSSTFNFGAKPLFNFSGNAPASAPSPITNTGIKSSVPPLPALSNASVFPKSNAQFATPVFPVVPSTSGLNVQISTQPTIVPTNKPLFNLGSSASSTFKSPNFSFSSASPETVFNPKPTVKPTVSVVDNTSIKAGSEQPFKPTETSKSFFQPVSRPSESPSGAVKPLFQPIAQQTAPVKPQVVPLANENASNFGPSIGSSTNSQSQNSLPDTTVTPRNVQHQPRNQPNINSPELTPHKPLLEQTNNVTPQQAQNYQKAEQSPTADNEIAQHTAKWNTTLQKNIYEEINNFNAELSALEESCSEINCQNLIGSRDELIEMRDNIAELVNHTEGYKAVMKENKSECSVLRESVLQNLKMIDEATLLKEKMEDKRYSNAMKSRPLDPISTRQRKALRANSNQVEQLLNDINVALDAKWEERIAYKRNAKNKTSAIAKRQQIYQTIDAIDQITNNLSGRLKKLSLQSKENNLLSITISNKSSNDMNTTRKSPKKNFRSQSTINSSPLKVKQLKDYLNNRGQTPVRRAKPYSSLIMPRDEDRSRLISDSIIPNAASTPAHRIASPNKVPQPVLSEKATLSSTLAKMGTGSMTPTVLHRIPSEHPTLKVPENTPTTSNLTPDSPPTKPSVQFDKPSDNYDISTEDVNKNLFGTPIAGNVSSIKTANPVSIVKQDFPTKPTSSVDTATFASSIPNVTVQNTATDVVISVNNVASKPFICSGVDPKSFWGTNNTKLVSGESGSDTSNSSPASNSSAGVSTAEVNQDVKATITVTESIVGTATNLSGGLFNNVISTPSSDALRGSVIKSVSDGVSEVTPLTIVSNNVAATSPPRSTTIFSYGASSAATVSADNVYTNSVSSVSDKTVLVNSATDVKVTTTFQPVNFFEAVTSPSGGIFGSNSIFGHANTNPTPTGIFGCSNTAPATSGIFGTAPKSSSIVLFEATQTSSSLGGLPGNVETCKSDGLLRTVVTTPSVLSFGTATPTVSGGQFVTATTNVPISTRAEPTTNTSAGLFGGTTTSASGSSFGTAPTTVLGGLFGTAPTTASNIIFEATTTTPGNLFATSTTTASGDLLGTTKTTSDGLFGTATVTAQSSLLATVPLTSNSASTVGAVINTTTTITSSAPSALFGTAVRISTSSSGGMFGTASTSSTPGGLFGTAATISTSGGLFGSTVKTSASAGLFGMPATTPLAGGLFGTATSTAPGVLFGSTATTSSSGGLFGTATSTTSGGLFGASATTSASSGGFFGTPSSAAPGGIFGTTSSASTFGGGLFGKPASSASGGLFGSKPEGLFSKPASTPVNIFGSSTTNSSNTFGASVFGAAAQPKEGGFSGFGLGSGPINDPNKNPFGSVSSTPGNNASVNIFGGPTSSTIGSAATTVPLGSGTFSKGFGSGIASGGAFGATTFGSPMPAPAGAFGGAPAFGSPPAFGGTPAFGGAPAFGSSPPAGSTFGSGATFGSASTFGSGTVFGGGDAALPSFGSLANQPAATPAFGNSQLTQSFGSGGFGTSPNPSGQQFSSWR